MRPLPTQMPSLWCAQERGFADHLDRGAPQALATGRRSTPSLRGPERASDYPRAAWRPAASCNHTNSNLEVSFNISKIVIHVAEGSYSGTIGWFQNCAAGSSAHYVVGRRGGVAQCVRDEDIAWHAGWWATNKHRIGTEHAGYTNNPNSFTRRMYRASARLSAPSCKKHKIPIDRKHIIGRYQVPGCSGSGGGSGCHTDPGRYWNWTKYMRLVRYYRDRL